MKLKDVLESKPTTMVSCTKDCKVADAVNIMDGKSVGSILIFDESNKLIGIFTERDIMHCFAKKISFADEVMQNVMSSNPVVLDSSVEISGAIKIMSEKKIRHLPVSENDKVIGMISYRDLVSFLLPEIIYMAEDIY